MNICVTGGAGFIGSHIVDAYINQGYTVCIIDNLSGGTRGNINEKAKFYECDITSPEIEKIFEHERFDILNHHAAQIDVRISVRNPKFDAVTNIIGGLNLYEFARRFGVKKIIFASSGGTVYGEQTEFPATENHTTNPISPYGVSKLSNEHYLSYYKNEYGIDYAALRYGNVFGPRQNPHGEAGVVAIFAKKLLENTQPVINGDGQNTRDYVYVADVAAANLAAISEEVSGAYNVGTGRERTVTEIFDILNNLTGGHFGRVHGDAKSGEQRRSVISAAKLGAACGWQPETSFEVGLERTVEFFRNIRRS
ncbi:SDR family oxidoreductase [Ignavibacteria bacterium]|nr:NAD-dependent epimerase/dehydratase family protein [Bacteroidota bacterium]MCZ2132547.1 NAD-dependent epimerase/dehydratase family protein [Bacteroidota bacterium]